MDNFDLVISIPIMLCLAFFSYAFISLMDMQWNKYVCVAWYLTTACMIAVVVAVLYAQRIRRELRDITSAIADGQADR